MRNIDPSTTYGDDITDLATYGDDVVFSGTSGSSEYLPWISNGTTAGTHALTNIGLGGHINTADFTVLGSDLLFESPGAAGATDLWSWNGSNASLLGSYAGAVSNLNDIGGEAYYEASDDLYETNGSAVTYLAGSASAPVTDYTIVGGIVYYVSGNQVYKLVGTSAVQITSFSNAVQSVFDLSSGPNGSLAFVSGNDETLWSSTGTADDATSVLTAVQGDAGGSSISGLTEIDGVIYFTISSFSEPDFVSDVLYSWTTTGITAVATINALYNADLSNLTDINGSLYFISSELGTGQIWTATASAGSAKMLTDLPGGVVTMPLVYSDGKVYFFGYDDNVFALYGLDASGAVQLVTTGVDPSAGIAVADTPYITAAAPSDFDGVGLSDVLWRKGNGDVAIWNLDASGSSYTSANIGDVGTDWHIAGVGDFNGAGGDGVLWRNSSGDITTWNAATSAPESFLGNGGTTTYVSPDWRIAGVGDFNGDWLSDILWRDTNGDVDIWYANAGPSPVSFSAQPVQHVSTDWHIAGVGDFNGSGSDGILWRNANGDLTTWNSLASDPGSFSGNSGETYHVGKEWKVAGVGDFNGDGLSDILWRDSNGDVDIWLSNGGSSPVSFTALAPQYVNTDWQIKGVGDYNGDGKADILWRNTNTGDVTIWESKPVTLSFTSVNLGVVSSDWHIPAKFP